MVAHQDSSDLTPATEELLGLGGATRERVLRGAAIAFSSASPDAVTVKDILEAAGISRRTFYKNFDSRDDALDGLHQIAARAFERRVLLTPMPGELVADLVCQAVDGWMSLIDALGGLSWVFYVEGLRPTGSIGQRRQETIKRVVAHLRPHVRPDLDPLLLWAWVVGLEAVVGRLLEENERGAPLPAAARRRVRALALTSLQPLIPDDDTTGENR